jgi:UDP-glucose 4-epimerase
MTRRVLITGGFGYIGGRVAQYLATRGDIEILLGTRGRAEAPAWLPEARPVHMDWESGGSLANALAGVQAVLHLAAMNENECAADPVAALMANGVATARLLEAAKTAGVLRFIHLSTAHVYAAPLAGHITEKTLPRPRHPYAISHRAAEDCVLAAHDAGSLAGIVLRLSNGFGAPAHPDVNRWTLLVNDLCRQAAERRRLVLRSAGLQMRDFITLHDVSRALSHCLDLVPDAVGDGLFNVGGESPLRVIDLVCEIAGRCEAVLGFAPEIDCPEPIPGETTLTLDYRMDKFKATGFVLAGDRQAEIDATLRLCRDTFGGRP